MNIGTSPKTVERLKHANRLLRMGAAQSVAEACRKAKVSRTYYRSFPVKYPDLTKDAGYTK